MKDRNKLVEGIEVLCHSSVKIDKSKKVYVDPFSIEGEPKDADFVFCTHEHYDHFSPKDIKKVINEKTIIVSVEKTKNELLKIQSNEDKIIIVKPNEEYKVGDISFKTIVAYNENKLFHPKEKQWVGYIIDVDNVSYYIAGETDLVKELATVKCDVAFVPVGGLYTMNSESAAVLVNTIEPEVAIPTHYGYQVGTLADACQFARLVNDEIDVEILL